MHNSNSKIRTLKSGGIEKEIQVENERSFGRRILAFFTLRKFGGGLLIAFVLVVLVAILRWDNGGDEPAVAAAGTPTVSAPTATPRRATPTKEPTAASTQTPWVVTATPEPTMVPTTTPVVIVVTATPEPTMVPTTTPTIAPTATMAPQPTATQPAQADTGTMPDLPVDLSHGSWTISANAGIDNDPIVRMWMGRIADVNPSKGCTYPNIPDPNCDPSFDVSHGLEYGVANVPFCQQDMRCDFVVPGWHYRLITADFSFLGMECNGGPGCVLILINVGEETVTWRNQMADNGFTVPGRYWHGDFLDEAVVKLANHVSANMLNMPTMSSPNTVLNSGDPANAGGNCGTIHGCDEVKIHVVVSAGDRILAVATTTVTRP